MKKAFVLLSGGVDSTTCLYIAKEMYKEVEAYSIDYGQKHYKEMQYAARSCKSLSIDHKVLNIKGLLDGKGVMLTDADTAIPSISYDDIQGMSPTYVPFRNGVLLSIITAQAQKWVMSQVKSCEDKLIAEGYNPDSAKNLALANFRDSTGVFFGAHAEDAFNWAYPDCTPEFIGAMGNAIYTGTYYTVRLHAPLMSLSKAQIVEWGTKLKVNWANTWSCYVGGEVHCGVCPTCRARRAAFKAAGVYDPTIYAANPELAA
jgi:7-cyano-7-deazaguanine synthase